MNGLVGNYMKKIIFLSLSFFILSCSTLFSAPKNGTRTIELDSVKTVENETDNGFTIWELVDYVYDDSTGIKVGYFDFKGTRIGFVLFDGENKGTAAIFSREGIDYRWDWGSEYQYCITISPDKVARYYDFSKGEKGEPQKSRGLYKAKKR